MKIQEAIKAILHQNSVESTVGQLIESDANLRRVIRNWETTGSRENLLAALAMYDRYDKDWTQDRYDSDLQKIRDLAKRYGWNIRTPDESPGPWYPNAREWKTAMIDLTTKDPKTPTANLPVPWPTINGQYQVWSLQLYYPKVGYIHKSKHAREKYGIPLYMAPKDFSSLEIPDRVKAFAKDLKKLFPRKTQQAIWK